MEPVRAPASPKARVSVVFPISPNPRLDRLHSPLFSPRFLSFPSFPSFHDSGFFVGLRCVRRFGFGAHRSAVRCFGLAEASLGAELRARLDRRAFPRTQQRVSRRRHALPRAAERVPRGQPRLSAAGAQRLRSAAAAFPRRGRLLLPGVAERRGASGRPRGERLPATGGAVQLRAEPADAAQLSGEADAARHVVHLYQRAAGEGTGDDRHSLLAVRRRAGEEGEQPALHQPEHALLHLAAEARRRARGNGLSRGRHHRLS